MRYLYLLLAGLFSVISTHAQLNATLQSRIEYGRALSSVWGWVAPNGTEYALVGVLDGVSIVSLADPRNAREVAFVPGANSRWREIKTWGHFAYVVVDEPGTSEGLVIIDLSQLPDRVSYSHWRPTIDNLPLSRCHNIYIDEKGLAFLCGCTMNSGGVLFVDVATTPGSPAYLGKGAPVYAHDAYALNNILYTSDIFAGRLAIYDINNLQNVRLLATQNTPFRFTHNAWLSDNGRVIYITDERSNASVTAYDISNLDDIRELTKFRPIYTLGTGTIPHNVHVKDDFLYISYYTVGGVIVDGSRPDNLVEVANYDTYPGSGDGFFGAWGIFPYLPSGNVLISDINTGLFVIKPTLQRACFLEGRITDAQTGQPLSGAEVRIVSPQPNLAKSNISGVYKTGQAQAGTFQVQITLRGYQPKDAQVVLQNGVVTILDVALNPLGGFNIGGRAVSSVDGSAVPFAKVVISNAEYTFETSATANGNFSFSNVFPGKYDIVVGAWGYLHKVVPDFNIDNSKSVTIALDAGYQDDFFFDFGWQTTANDATAGFWVREKPLGSTFGNALASPDRDIEGDLGNRCYLTGNEAGPAGNSDVDDGAVLLTSPPMDLTRYTNPIVQYYLWFYNDGGTGAPPNDQIVVRISNGAETIVLETVRESRSAWRPRSEFALRDRIRLTNNMRLIFEAADFPPGHIVKAAVDAVLVRDQTATSTETLTPYIGRIEVFPNPFQQQLTVRYELEDSRSTLLLVQNALGQVVLRIPLSASSSVINFGEALDTGVYFLRLQNDRAASAPLKVLKVR